MNQNPSLGRPTTEFLNTARGSIGYQVFGSGERDIVFITQWMSNIDMYWDEPSAVRYFDRLASMGRVIHLDKLGSGVSDLAEPDLVSPIEDYVEDIQSVLAAVGSEQATLIGDTEGGMLAMMLAATYPAQFPRLVLVNTYAKLRRADDYPIGATDAAIDSMKTAWIEQYGTTGNVLYLTAPSVAEDARFKSWFVRFQRAAQKPRVAKYAVDWISNTDVRAALSSIQADTLVVHRKDAMFHRLTHAEYVADHIDNARLVVVEGADTFPFHAGDFGPTLDLVEEFLTGKAALPETNRMLATVMFTDIVGSTALASEIGDERWLDLRSEHDRLVLETLERFRGERAKMTGDGALATFDGPHRAVLCALALKQSLDGIDLPIRIGIHTGEVEVRDGELGGLAVNIASRVMDTAETGGILVSGTVKDLVVGSPIDFNHCGSYELKGVPGSWNLFEVEAPFSV